MTPDKNIPLILEVIMVFSNGKVVWLRQSIVRGKGLDLTTTLWHQVSMFSFQVGLSFQKKFPEMKD